MYLTLLALITISATLLLYRIYHTLVLHPLAQVPGPKTFALTKWRLAYEDYRGTRTRTIHHLHDSYGPAVRIGPHEISFNSLPALRQIYGAGSAFGRPQSFYRLFDIFGQPHMFTFYSSYEHAARKKVLAQLYAKSTVVKGPVADSIRDKVAQFAELVETRPRTASCLATSLHYYALDNISWMVFRDAGRATAALSGRELDCRILGDIGEPTARRYSWFQCHLPRYTSWAMSRGSRLGAMLDAMGLLPGKKPLAYSGLQEYALATFNAQLREKSERDQVSDTSGSLMARLRNAQAMTYGKDSIADLDIAAECADHLDAGLKTTSDSLMFALWALSLPDHQNIQQRLAAEVDTLRDKTDNRSISPTDLCDRLPFLDAVIKETLRLYAPIPASQPRTSTRDTTIDGYAIPAGTLVSCQAYSLHRNPDVFTDPYTFNPARWLGDEEAVAEMKRWWWPFSSGARMCLGMQ